MKKNIFLFGLVFLSLGIFLDTTFAVPGGSLPGVGNTFVEPPEAEVDENLKGTDFRAKLLTIVSYFITFVGIIAVVAIIYFGFLWLTSGGNDEQIEKGKKGITWVALGILVILFAWVFVAFLIDAGDG